MKEQLLGVVVWCGVVKWWGEVRLSILISDSVTWVKVCGNYDKKSPFILIVRCWNGFKYIFSLFGCMYVCWKNIQFRLSSNLFLREAVCPIYIIIILIKYIIYLSINYVHCKCWQHVCLSLCKPTPQHWRLCSLCFIKWWKIHSTHPRRLTTTNTHRLFMKTCIFDLAKFNSNPVDRCNKYNSNRRNNWVVTLQ